MPCSIIASMALRMRGGQTLVGVVAGIIGSLGDGALLERSGCDVSGQRRGMRVRLTLCGVEGRARSCEPRMEAVNAQADRGRIPLPYGLTVISDPIYRFVQVYPFKGLLSHPIVYSTVTAIPAAIGARPHDRTRDNPRCPLSGLRRQVRGQIARRTTRQRSHHANRRSPQSSQARPAA